MRLVWPPRETACRCCGTNFLQEKNNSGRRADYCSATCRDLMKFWNAFNRKIDSVVFTNSARSRWSGELFRLRNQLGNNKKGAGV